MTYALTDPGVLPNTYWRSLRSSSRYRVLRVYEYGGREFADLVHLGTARVHPITTQGLVKKYIEVEA